VTAKATSWIGSSVQRLEDLPLVTGRGRFAGDISFPHELHMRMVRSASPSGKIKGVDYAEALNLPGVVAVWTSADFVDIPIIDFREGANEALAPFRQPILAKHYVRYVGEPIAAVFAADAYIAEDAADLVNVEIDELPAVADALATPARFTEDLTTEATICRRGFGDVDAAFKNAAATVELNLSVGRHSAVPLESRGALGRYDAARDVLELYGAAKVPHKNRESLARILGRSQAGLHVFEAHVGGGFGVRGEIYPEDILVLIAAMRLGRPVKWLEDRREHMIATNHSRQQHHRIRVAVDLEGHLLAIDDEFFQDQGAYLRTHGTRVVETSCGMLPGPYRLSHYRVRGHVRLTNKTPSATYRSPGRYEVNFVRERLMDAIARKLRISRLDIRRRNLISSREMPYSRPEGLSADDSFIDSGEYEGLLDQALLQSKWSELEKEVSARRASGEHVGLGIAMYLEKSGHGPSDGCRIHVHTTGDVEVITGGASVGQGFETVMAQVCAETLGVDYHRIRVVHGRTDRIEYGIGAHATRATVMTANATAVAAAKVRVKAIDMAAQLLQQEASRLTIVNGCVMAVDGRGTSIGLDEIAQQLRPESPVLCGREPGLTAEGWFTTSHLTYPYGVQVALVSIDGGTGAIRVEKVFIAFDVGRAINPMLVRGQLVGGFVQGLGGALLEEFQYDDQGQPLSVTMADYLMPTAGETPEIDVLISEHARSLSNPLGIKGAGEGGVAAAGAVIASAVDDALGGGCITRLPITPQFVKAVLGQRELSQ
jgi:aerobic carbon-monoxide dehydrogenase large subunit